MGTYEHLFHCGPFLYWMLVVPVYQLINLHTLIKTINVARTTAKAWKCLCLCVCLCWIICRKEAWGKVEALMKEVMICQAFSTVYCPLRLIKSSYTDTLWAQRNRRREPDCSIRLEVVFLYFANVRVIFNPQRLSTDKLNLGFGSQESHLCCMYEDASRKHSWKC